MTPESKTPHAHPYETVRPAELILRDQLAIDRTVLANERTLLAYVRTALTLFLVGISFVHLPDLYPAPGWGDVIYAVAGWAFVGVAAIVLGVGYVRYQGFKADILQVQQRSQPSD